MRFKLPTEADIERMLAMIVGEDARAKRSNELEAGSVTHLGVYIDREDKPVAVCEADLNAAVGLGCALSMIPQAGMGSMLENGEMSDSAKLNLYEVMNIFSGLFMDDHTEHLRLTEVVESDFDTRIPDGAEAVGFVLTLGRYGTGQIRFRSL